MSPFALLLWFLPAVLRQEGEMLLREVDAKITAAKALRVEFEIPTLGRGVLVLAGRDRVRIELTSPGSDQNTITVSDGKRVGGVGHGQGAPPLRPFPDWHNEVLRSWLGRGGTYVSMAEAWRLAQAPDAARPGPDDGPRVANARLLAVEEVGGVKAPVVEYDLSWRVIGQAFRDARVRVWIDPKTKLPVRREMTFRDGSLSGTYTATHTKFEIDPKLDDKLFELPK